MMIFFKDTDITRSILDRIASYSVLLLDPGKSSYMDCSIIFPVGALSCKPTPAPVFREALSTLRIHQPELSEFASRWGIFAKEFANICPFNAKRGLY